MKPKEIKNLDVFWRKVIVFVVLLVLAVPLFVIIVINFKSRTSNLKQEDFSFGLSEEIGQSLNEIQDLQETFQQEMASTTQE